MKDQSPNSWEARADAHSFYGFTDLPTIENRGATVLTHGSGPYVFDVHGRQFLDANSGLWNMVAGFDHAGLAQPPRINMTAFPAITPFLAECPTKL